MSGERGFKTERQWLREQGLLPQPVDFDGQTCLKYWDAEDYVRAQGFPASADYSWMEVNPANTPYTTVDQSDPRKPRYLARRKGAGLRVGGDDQFALAAPIWGGWAYLWVYPVETLDAAMEAYQNGQFYTIGGELENG